MDFMTEHRRLEHYGVQLLQRTIKTLNEVLPRDSSASVQAMHRGWSRGPDFDYAASYDLFLGRHGVGPLYVAWDTNILLDYFEHGANLWADTELPETIPEDHHSELECLQLVFALWVIRDVRIVVLNECIDDAKKQLREEQRSARVNAFEEFSHALRLTPDGSEDQISRAGLLALPDSAFNDALASVPRGLDQRMVSAAYRSGAHVFLTRDKGVLQARARFRPLGLLITSPGDLFQGLLETGAFNCVLNPALAYWPLPDQQRVAHLIRALPNYSI